ncbi:MAG: 5-histidylcysteine sulfoxide synthase [Campylobacteraceae bacterium]|jgi:5-histidylcysteine sulfoxide synthase/putative 4-mercaptohistidine N1-methyltranferase|nr:5-histidylcysteine sulfoxide synthase [Campylobacteraceae bacterium]
MVNGFNTRNIKLGGANIREKRAEILEYFLKTYELYDRLFDILKDDSVFYEQPEPLRHPLIFYYGHTAAFYVNKLVLAKKIERINPKFESIFAIGVDEMSWDDLNQARYEWPSVEETREYRAKVKEAVLDFIKSGEFSLPISWNDSFWAVIMGCEHERIHLETSSVLIRQLGIEKVKETPLFNICDKSGEAPANELLKVAGGLVELGKTHDDDYYGWDNEYGHFESRLKEFKASKYLVTNGEFLEFVKDGGYQKPEFWSDEGRAWLEYKKPSHPVFWVPSDDGYRYRALNKVIEMPKDWPVDVNYLEAKAYCNWLSKKIGKTLRLPTEAEWHRLREYSGAKEEPRWGSKALANINLEHYASACPVTEFAHGDFYDVIGNVWQWTETPIYPFEGFDTHPLYDDFSTPTFDGRHNIIKGGSFISTGNEVLSASRYAFRRHFFQHAGFRYVESDNPVNDQTSVYETDSAVSEYLEFHYGDEYFGVANFPSKIARIALSFSAGTSQKKALDIGCAVGRCTFELAKVFEEVIGIDFSARFIKNAVQMKEDGVVRYKIKQEGDITEAKEVFANEFGFDEESISRVQFWQGDACNLKPHFRDYDLIVAANLIDRLYDPQKFLKNIHERLNFGGVLLIASPYSWDVLFTSKDKWLTSKEESGFAALKRILSDNFVMLGEPIDVEFVIRESARKFQHTVSQVSVWKRKS